MKVTFRYAGIDEYPEISRFLNDYWAENHVYVRDRDLFHWTFDRRSLWDHDGYTFALAEDEGELVGILGGIPFTFNRYGDTCLGVWIANYVVRPDHRRGTVALQLLSQFRRPPFQQVVAFGINPATATIYRVLRGKVLPPIPRHFIVFPDGAERADEFLAIAHADWSPAQRKDIIDAFKVDQLPEFRGSCAGSVPDDWDANCWPAFAKTTVGAARDAAFLKWRYLEHPTFQYRILALKDGERTGLAIWRLEMIHQLDGEVRKPLHNIARLVEYMPVSEGNAEQLVAAFLNEAQKAGAFGADYYGFHGPSRRQLAQAGLKLTKSHEAGEHIPSRFQPLDGKGGEILSAGMLEGGIPECEISDDCPWYWTKADSDQDRPN